MANLIRVVEREWKGGRESRGAGLFPSALEQRPRREVRNLLVSSDRDILQAVIDFFPVTARTFPETATILGGTLSSGRPRPSMLPGLRPKPFEDMLVQQTIHTLDGRYASFIPKSPRKYCFFNGAAHSLLSRCSIKKGANRSEEFATVRQDKPNI